MPLRDPRGYVIKGAFGILCVHFQWLIQKPSCFVCVDLFSGERENRWPAPSDMPYKPPIKCLSKYQGYHLSEKRGNFHQEKTSRVGK